MPEWELVYTPLQVQYFDFDAVALIDEKAVTLSEYMRTQHATLDEEL